MSSTTLAVLSQVPVVASLSLPSHAQWLRLREHLGTIAPPQAEPWAQQIKKFSPPSVPGQQQQTLTAKQHVGKAPLRTSEVAVHVFSLELSLVDFWHVYDHLHQSVVSDRAVSLCTAEVERLVNVSGPAYVCCRLPVRSSCARDVAQVIEAYTSLLPPPPGTIFSGLLRGRSWAMPGQRCNARRPCAVSCSLDSNVLNGNGRTCNGTEAMPRPAAAHLVCLLVTNLFEAVPRQWNYRLNALAGTRQALLHTNALISTLGGGYFMYVGIEVARRPSRSGSS